MNRYVCAGLFALVAAASPASANHGSPDGGLNEREYRLEQRIEHGWRSGELSRQEYRRLNYELREIERAERHFKSDGFFSQRELSALHARLDGLSRAVYRDTRDLERRHGPYNHDYRADRRY
jgi:hypothetical protein